MGLALESWSRRGQQPGTARVSVLWHGLLLGQEEASSAHEVACFLPRVLSHSASPPIKRLKLGEKYWQLDILKVVN